jgi:hypothetical protein
LYWIYSSEGRGESIGGMSGWKARMMGMEWWWRVRKKGRKTLHKVVFLFRYVH